MALRYLDVGPGDEVFTVSMTFTATAWAISYVGATPVFVNIDPVRRTLNVDNLEAAITPRTKAIIPVHLYGMAAEMVLDALRPDLIKHDSITPATFQRMFGEIELHWDRRFARS